MIRVLQVFGSLGMGGAESRMMDVYRHLDREKYEFDFVTLQKGKQYYYDEITAMGGKIIEIGSPREIGTLTHVRALRDVMRENQYDAVHAHTSHHCGVVMAAAKWAGVPIRISHSRNTDSKQANTKLFRAYLTIGRSLIRLFSTKRLAITKAAGEFLYGKTSYDVIPNSIDLQKYQSKDKIDEIREELGINADDFVVGQIGRFEKMKNHGFTIQWFSHYYMQHPDAKLVLVGDGALRKEIEERVFEEGLADRVVFTGVRGDVPQLIRVFQVLLFPSLHEGLGGVVLEAQATGVPVVESENIPPEADLNIGMVTNCGLDAKLEAWDNAVDRYREYTAPDDNVIRAAFDKCGYSIESVTNAYCQIYAGEKR